MGRRLLRLHPSSFSYRVYRVRLGTAFALSLPFLLAVGWYAWSAYARFDRYRSAFDEAVPLTPELFHLELHDELTSDLRRFRIESRPEHSQIPTYSVSLARAELDRLYQESAEGGGPAYAAALLEKDGTVHKTDIRLRGSQPWHRLGQQKSLKFKLEKGDLIDGVRFFNLLNDVTPMGLEEQVILDLARERGLLAPEYHPVWLRLNNSDMGVYRYVAQPAEGLLRRARRMPGSLYSGDTNNLDEARGLTSLFSSREGWKKIAWRVEEERESFAELERFLSAVQSFNHEDFSRFAANALDLPRFALFDALDVVFGGSQHDNLSNQKLHYDHYRGRFEPIAWSYRAFAHEPVFNVVEHPLLLRLASVPEYSVLRDRTVYELLTRETSVPAIRNRIDGLFEALRPDLEADPFWDAYKLLPRTSRFVRFMVRPMTVSRWLLSTQAELDQYEKRARFLMDALEKPNLETRVHALDPSTLALELSVDGHAAYELDEAVFSSNCTGALELSADRDLDGALGAEDTLLASGEIGQPLSISRFNRLTPGFECVAHPRPTPKTGKVLSERRALTFRYFLRHAECPPDEATLTLKNLVTGAALRTRLGLKAKEGAGEASAARALADPGPRGSDVPKFAPGERSPHPWRLPERPPPTTTTLGPGTVSIAESRTFESHENVDIRPGTRLLLGAGVSLIFRGRVLGRGTQTEPIEILRSGSEPFGGLAIHGPGSTGSELRHVRLSGGSRPALETTDYSGTLSIYDTADITLADSTFSDISEADDVLHATYVKSLRLNEIHVVGAPTDAMDLEFVSGEVRGAVVGGAGDECLDLMGVDLSLLDSVLVGCTNSAVSAGEESKVRARGVFIAEAKNGVLSKNASEVSLSRSLVYKAESALRTNKREVHYNVPSHIDASELAALDCDKVERQADDSAIVTGAVRRSLAGPSELEYLRTQVLRLASWEELDTFVRDVRTGRLP